MIGVGMAQFLTRILCFSLSITSLYQKAAKNSEPVLTPLAWKEALYKLLELLQEKDAVTIAADQIPQLENIWTQNNRQPVPQTEYPVRAVVCFSAFLRSHDWRVVRKLSCVTSSQRAAEELTKIANKSWPGLLNDWVIRHWSCLMPDVQSLRWFSGKWPMISALFNVGLSLQLSGQSEAENGLTWAKAQIPQFDPWGVLDKNGGTQSLSLGFHHSSMLDEVLRGRTVTVSLPLARLLHTSSNLGLHGAVLLKKAPSWPENCPTYCCMVFDEQALVMSQAWAKRSFRHAMIATFTRCRLTPVVEVVQKDWTGLLSRHGRMNS